uniref:Hydrophobin n=1 Tax=Ganoderma boninense TaxID=34458 RepID=A0A5K1K5W6_9APHY|nr:Endopolygalacturonase (Polygalacturonase) [Ganoderma boninense]
MFAKALLAFSALAVLAAATPAPAPAGGQSCSTGSIQCCNSVQAANSPAAAALLASIGVVVQDLTTLIGITCSPISVVNVGGADAWIADVLVNGDCSSAETVCCEDNAVGEDLARSLII